VRCVSVRWCGEGEGGVSGRVRENGFGFARADGDNDYLGGGGGGELDVISSAYRGTPGGIPGPSFEVILLGIGISTLGIDYKRMRTLT
jgi:hypothetical protein